MKSELSQGVLPKQQMNKAHEKARKAHAHESAKVPVRIDSRTIIFVLPSELEGAKERYIESHQYQTGVKKYPKLSRRKR